MSRNSQDLVNQLQQKLKEAEQIETRAGNARRELEVVRQELSSLKETVKAETQKLLLIREKKLKDTLEPLESNIADLTTILQDMKLERTGLAEGNGRLMDDRDATIEEIEGLEHDKAHLVELNKNADKDLKDKRTAFQDLSKETQSLKAILAQLTTQKNKVQERIDELLDEKNEVQGLVEKAKTMFTQLTEEKAKELKNTDLRLELIRQDIERESAEIETQRKDIAVRHRAQDDRDRVLRIREQKAGAQEDRIRQNAELLDL